MVRYHYGRDEYKLSMVSQMFVHKQVRLELYCPTHDIHLETAVLLLLRR